MRPLVCLRLPDGTVSELGHGDLIGRLGTAALHLDDPRVSEAHAMVSLRGGALKLLALRGRFTVDGRAVADVELRPGMTVKLARDLDLHVDSIVLPDAVLALQVGHLEERVLSGLVSVFTDPRPGLKPGFASTAAAHVWTSGESLRLRTAEGLEHVLAAGDSLELGGTVVRVVERSLLATGPHVTLARGAVSAPLRLVARYHSVHIFRLDEPVVTLTGISARLVSELVACGVPVAWETVAAEIWGVDASAAQGLRQKWDVAVTRLRAKLRAARIRTNLVQADGSGNFELVLESADEVVDET